MWLVVFLGRPEPSHAVSGAPLRWYRAVSMVTSEGRGSIYGHLPTPAPTVGNFVQTSPERVSAINFRDTELLSQVTLSGRGELPWLPSASPWSRLPALS